MLEKSAGSIESATANLQSLNSTLSGTVPAATAFADDGYYQTMANMSLAAYHLGSESTAAGVNDPKPFASTTWINYVNHPAGHWSVLKGVQLGLSATPE